MGVCGASCDFARDYEIAQTPLMRDIERLVRGTDYGATSWTTQAQAEQTIGRLALGPGVSLLDVGTGSGWPGLFLTRHSGCTAVLTDLPLSGLRTARSRAQADGIARLACVVAADGTALPFPDRSFDRIHHADVLCCMGNKQAMLRECRRVARAAALMEFSVIWLLRPPSGPEEVSLLGQSGPPFPDADGDYAAMLPRTGWRVLERVDVTDEFTRCMNVLMDESRRRRDDLVELLGPAEYQDRLRRRESTLAAVSRGLLRREIFVCH